MNKKGFTLIELILSMAILGILLVAFMTVFNFSYFSIINAGNRTDAAYVANGITDSLFSAPFNSEASIQTFLSGKGYGTESANVTAYVSKNVNYKVTNGVVLNVNGSTVEIAVFYNSRHDYVQFTVFVPYGG